MPWEPSYTEDEVEAALRRYRGLISYAAEHLKVTCPTIYNYLKRYPRLQEVLKECRSKRIDVAESNLDKALDNGEQWATLFTLKMQGKDRGYIEKQQTELSGGIGVETVENDNLADFRKRYAAGDAGTDGGEKPADPPLA